MCQFKSAIVLKDRIVCPLDMDSHTDILDSLQSWGIKDESVFPNFVRIEMLPVDNNIFNHNPENWKLHVSQDYIPDWFSAEKAEKQMREIYMPEVFKKRFVIYREVKEIKEGRWFVKGGLIQRVYSSATIQRVYGSATIQQVYGSAAIQQVCDSAKIQDVYGSATIQDVYDSAKIHDVYGSATIQGVYDSATIQHVYNSAKIQRVCSGKVRF